MDILDEVLANTPTRWKAAGGVYPYAIAGCSTVKRDFDFLQHICEWGIYWWFEHSEDSHTLKSWRMPSAPFHSMSADLAAGRVARRAEADKEFIHTIAGKTSLRTGQWVLDDFDFTKPPFIVLATGGKPA